MIHDSTLLLRFEGKKYNFNHFIVQLHSNPQMQCAQAKETYDVGLS